MDDAARESGSGAGAALPKSLLVGTDGSPTALVAVRRAAMLAKALDCQLTVVCAQRREARGEGLWAGAVADTSSGASASAAAQMIAEEAAALAREMGATKTTARAISGEPADAILEEANEIGVDLIVVGSRGMRSAARRLLGAVPNKVVHNAGCDVLVVETAG